MKKIAVVAALALMTGALFAQVPGGMGPGRGAGIGPAIDWKVGTVVTTEYKKLTGTVSIGQTLAPTFKADGVEYQLWLPRSSDFAALKNGDTITVEGTFTTVKSDAKVAPVMHPFKVTVNGKEIDLTTLNYGRGNRDDRGGKGMMGGWDNNSDGNTGATGMMGGRGNGPRR